MWVAALVGAACALAVLAAWGTGARAQDGAPPPLEIDKSIKPKTVIVGQQQVYTIDVTNNTGSQVTGVTVRDPLPQGVSFVKARTSLRIPGSCSLQSKRTVVCGPYTLSKGQSFTIDIYVKTTKVGKYTNTAYVSYTPPGGLGASPEASDSARHRAVKKDRCDGVQAGGGKACVGGAVKAGNGNANVGGIKAR